MNTCRCRSCMPKEMLSLSSAVTWRGHRSSDSFLLRNRVFSRGLGDVKARGDPPCGRSVFVSKETAAPPPPSCRSGDSNREGAAVNICSWGICFGAPLLPSKPLHAPERHTRPALFCYHLRASEGKLQNGGEKEKEPDVVFEGNVSFSVVWRQFCSRLIACLSGCGLVKYACLHACLFACLGAEINGRFV